MIYTGPLYGTDEEQATKELLAYERSIDANEIHVSFQDDLNKNYRKVPLETIPDCCGICYFGDIDGEGCEVLQNILFGEQSLDVDFNFFHTCDDFRRTDQAGYDSYWPCTLRGLE